MRLWFGGPRIFGIPTGISIGPEDFARRTLRPVRYAPALNSSVSQLGPCFVYVIRGEHDRCKIGISSNPNARIAQLRTASPFMLSFTYIGVVESNDATNVEREAHAILDRYRMNGEWFDCPAELAVAAVNAAGARMGEKIAPVDPTRVDDLLAIAYAQEAAKSFPPPKPPPSGVFGWIIFWLMMITATLALGYQTFFKAP